jgi:hypothetical protein
MPQAIEFPNRYLRLIDLAGLLDYNSPPSPPALGKVPLLRTSRTICRTYGFTFVADAMLEAFYKDFAPG